jgi:hypothetical protein
VLDWSLIIVTVIVAPATFATVLTAMQGIKFVIFGETLHVHNEKLREVLGRVRKHNLKLQPDKC